MPGRTGRNPQERPGGASGAVRLPVGAIASRARYVHLQPGSVALIITPVEWAALSEALDANLNTRGGRAVGKDSRLGAVARKLEALREEFMPPDVREQA